MGSGNLGCGANIAKIILFIFNFCFWLSGAALLAVGIWARVDSASLSEKLEEYLQISSQDNNFNNIAYLFIAVGAFIFVVGFSGCCGAIKESRCLLGVYITLLVIVMICELAAVIAVAVFRKDIEKGLQEGGTKYIQDNYAFPPSTETDKVWNTVMIAGECCGMTGASDFQNSTFQKNNGGVLVPDFCCTLNKDKSNETSASPVNRMACLTEAASCLNTGACANLRNFNSQGCYQAGVDYVSKHAIIFIGVGAGLGALELFGLLFAVCLCRAIGNEDKY